jgi:hypothetical protein
MGNIGAILAAARVPVNVHFSITQGGVLQPTFVCTQSRGRIDANLLAQLWVRTMHFDMRTCIHTCIRVFVHAIAKRIDENYGTYYMCMYANLVQILP